MYYRSLRKTTSTSNSSKISSADYKDEFLNRISIRDCSKTVDVYSFWIKKFTEFSGKSVDNITFVDVKNYVDSLKKDYSESSVRFAVGITKRYLSFCEKHGAPLDADEILLPRSRVQSHLPITSEEYVSILSNIKTDTRKGIRDNVVIRMLYDTGARLTEIATIEREGIDIETRTAEIWTEKTTRKRLIMWGHDTNAFLKCWMDIHPGRVFPCGRTIERIVTQYAKMAGIEKHIVPHSFRHGKAHTILDNGGTVKDIQEALGHVSPVSSFRYLNLSRDEKIKRLNSFLNEEKV